MNPHGESALLCASRPEAGPGPDLLEVALEARRSVRGVEHRAVQSADPAARDRGHPGYEGRRARGRRVARVGLEKMLERRLVRRRARTFSGVRAARLGARERGRGRGGRGHAWSCCCRPGRSLRYATVSRIPSAKSCVGWV